MEFEKKAEKTLASIMNKILNMFDKDYSNFEAIYYYDRALNEYERSNDTVNIIRVKKKIIKIFSLMNELNKDYFLCANYTFDIGCYYLGENDIETSIFYFGRLVSSIKNNEILNPLLQDYYIKIANLYYEKNRMTEALDTYSKLFELSDEFKEFKDKNIYINFICALIYKNKYIEAEKKIIYLVKKSILGKYYGEQYYVLAVICYMLDDFKKAKYKFNNMVNNKKINNQTNITIIKKIIKNYKNEMFNECIKNIISLNIVSCKKIVDAIICQIKLAASTTKNPNAYIPIQKIETKGDLLVIRCINKSKQYNGDILIQNVTAYSDNYDLC